MFGIVSTRARGGNRRFVEWRNFAPNVDDAAFSQVNGGGGFGRRIPGFERKAQHSVDRGPRPRRKPAPATTIYLLQHRRRAASTISTSHPRGLRVQLSAGLCVRRLMWNLFAQLGSWGRRRPLRERLFRDCLGRHSSGHVSVQFDPIPRTGGFFYCLQGVHRHSRC